MNAFTTLAHNGRLMFQAEHIINSFLRSETENHKVACFLVNPDGSRIAIQKGFKLENYEYVLCAGNGTCENNETDFDAHGNVFGNPELIGG